MKQLYPFLIVILSVFACEKVFCQAMAPSTGHANNVVIPPNFSRTMFVKQTVPSKETRKGSPLQFNAPQTGSIYTTKFGTLIGIPFNYDVEKHVFEIYLEKTTKLLPDIHVDSFEVKAIKYVKLEPLTESVPTKHLSGFGRLIKQKGDVFLVDNSFLYIKEPNYNLATNTGEKAETIEVREAMYVINKENIYKLPLSKKETKAFFGEQFERIDKEVKNEKKKLNKEGGLVLGIDLL